jgi:hypothetical protein
LFPSVSGFLAGVTEITPSSEIVSGLLKHPRDSSSWLLLAKLASSPAGADFLLAHSEWLDGCSADPKGALRVVMVLCIKPGQRAAVASLLQYSKLLTLCCQLNDDGLLAAVPVVAGRCSVSGEMLNRLSRDGFWTAFFDAVSKSQDLEVHSTCMILMNHFARVGWTPEFARYIAMVPTFFSVIELVEVAFELLLVVSFLAEGARLIVELKMVDYFKALRGNERYGDLATRILQNIGRHR